MISFPKGYDEVDGNWQNGFILVLPEIREHLCRAFRHLNPGAADDLYVSLLGDDRWSGTAATPNAEGTDGPVSTVERAQELVRNLRAVEPHRPRPIVVALRGGRYELSATLKFSANDGGTGDSPTRYEAYQDESPILSGGTVIGGWKVGADGRWRTTIKKSSGADWGFAQLFVNDQRRFRPTLPSDDYYRIAESVPPSAAAEGKGYDRFHYAKGDLRPDWANIDDIELLVFHKWSASRMRIKTLDDHECAVQFTGPTVTTAAWGVLGKGQRYRVDNVKEALTQQGQWYLDRPSGELTYIPMPGETPENSVIIAPRIEVLVRLESDDPDRPLVEHLEFRGLTFAHSQWTLPAAGQSIAQAEVRLSAAIEAKGVKNVRFDRCTLRELGGYGIALRDGCQDNTISQCELVDLGAGGVMVGTMERRKPTSHGESIPPAITSEVLRNTVRDSTIAHGGRLHPAAVGVWIGHASHNVITHNDIYDLYYTAVSVGWQWGYAESRSNHNQITFNHLHTIGQGVLSDMGGDYTLGISPGTVVSNNVVHDVRSFDYGGWGLYNDEGSTDIVMENNLVYRTRTGGFHHHYGRNNRITNNIFAFAEQQQLQRTRVEDHRSFTFERNIVYWDNDSPLLNGQWRDNHVKMDSNLYWSSAPGQLKALPRVALGEWWQETGYDQHSVVADPKFIDARGGNFHLRPDSPAGQVGFVPFDYQRAGRETPTRYQEYLPAVPMAFK